MLLCRRVLLPSLPRLQRLIIRPHPLSSASHLRHLHIALSRSHTGPPAYPRRHPARFVFRPLPLARLSPFQSTQLTATGFPPQPSSCRTSGQPSHVLYSYLHTDYVSLYQSVSNGVQRGGRGRTVEPQEGRRGLGVDLRLASNPEATRWSNFGGLRRRRGLRGGSERLRMGVSRTWPAS